MRGYVVHTNMVQNRVSLFAVAVMQQFEIVFTAVLHNQIHHLALHEPTPLEGLNMKRGVCLFDITIETSVSMSPDEANFCFLLKAAACAEKMARSLMLQSGDCVGCVSMRISG